MSIQLLEYAIPLSSVLCPRHKKSGLQYLGNKRSYHRSADGKTTREKKSQKIKNKIKNKIKTKNLNKNLHKNIPKN